MLLYGLFCRSWRCRGLMRSGPTFGRRRRTDERTACFLGWFVIVLNADPCNERIRRTMDNLQLMKAPIAKAEMLIRKPAAKVFEAFVDPEITRRFWFTKSTGRLETGKHIVWTWEMYDMSIEVEVKEVEPNKRI